MELIALKSLSNGIKAGQTFVESNQTIIEILIATGAAREVSHDPPRLRRRRSASSDEAPSA